MSTISFTQALERAELLARQSLDAALHERLSCAVSLVKDGHTFQTSSGDWQVDSSTEGLTYTVNGTCECQDFHYHKPPKGLCKHRLAMFLSQRVQTLMQHPAVPVVPEVLPEPWPDNDPEEEIPLEQPAPPPAPLPEAPASVNVRVTIAGREVQWTLRDTDEARLAVRLAALLARYPVPQSTPQGASQAEGLCHIHQVQMKWNAGKDGKSGWWSHRTPDGWCKGR